MASRGLHWGERRALLFLRRAPLVRRRGGWRFGTAKISDAIVDRLVASGEASIDGETVNLVHSGESR
jgi:hypothetical protein